MMNHAARLFFALAMYETLGEIACPLSKNTVRYHHTKSLATNNI